jgi:hypothetical protein
MKPFLTGDTGSEPFWNATATISSPAACIVVRLALVPIACELRGRCLVKRWLFWEQLAMRLIG